MTKKMTYPELKIVTEALSLLGALPNKPNGYAITKNLTEFNRTIRDTDKIARILGQDAVDKDEVGNPKQYKTFVIVEGKAVEQEITKISDPKTLANYNKEVKKLNEDVHEVKIHQMLYNDFEEYEKKNGIDSNIMAELYGVVIVDKIEDAVA